jgi:hypothetical protein
MTSNRIANHLIFWTLIVGVFVLPLGMLASDFSTGRCDYFCSRSR